MDKAKQSASDLQKTIAETSVSAEQQQSLDELSQHIDLFQADPEAHHLSFRQRLEQSLAEFGAEHQALNDAIQVVLSDLSNAGV